MTQEFEQKRLQLMFKFLKESEETFRKKLDQTESGFKNQMRKDFEYDAAGHAVVDRCKHGMWNTFKKYLRESAQLAEMWEVKKANVLLKQNNDEKTRQKDLFFTQIFESEAEDILSLHAKKIEEIAKYEKYEKKRVSLGVVQRFVQSILQQRRIAKQEIENINKNLMLEKFQKFQELKDLDLPWVSSLPMLSERKTVKLSHSEGKNVPELPEVVVRQPEQQVTSYRVNAPHLTLTNLDDANYREIDQNSNSSISGRSGEFEQPERQIDPRWFKCADGFDLYDRGNGWAQDEDRCWYCYNPETHSWDFSGWAQDEQKYWYCYNSVTDSWKPFENNTALLTPKILPTYGQTMRSCVTVGNPRLLQ